MHEGALLLEGYIDSRGVFENKGGCRTRGESIITAMDICRGDILVGGLDWRLRRSWPSFPKRGREVSAYAVMRYGDM